MADETTDTPAPEEPESAARGREAARPPRERAGRGARRAEARRRSPAEEPAARPPKPGQEPAAEEPAARAAGRRAAAPRAAAAEARAVEEDEEDEPAPRERPAIPGADLEVDIVPEGVDPLADASRSTPTPRATPRRRAASEELERGGRRRPIEDVAIDLAAGARYSATGKRKTAIARVTLRPGTGTYTINGRTLEEFFPRETLQRIIRQPLETVGYESRMDVIARMHGGGVSAQAGALRHGISRALLEADPNLRGELKRRGFLTRDPRVKERKKAGLKKARKRPQFSKR